LSSSVYLSPRENYLTPYTNIRRTNTPRTYQLCLNISLPKVLETDKIEKSFDHEGNKKINEYVIVSHIGRGGFGKVKKVFTQHNK